MVLIVFYTALMLHDFLSNIKNFWSNIRVLTDFVYCHCANW